MNKQKRLTQRNPEFSMPNHMFDYKISANNLEYHAIINDDNDKVETIMGEHVDKLAYYENLEEEDRLVDKEQVLDILYEVFERYNISTDKNVNMLHGFRFGNEVFKRIKEL